jgi:hypothetical protein
MERGIYAASSSLALCTPKRAEARAPETNQDTAAATFDLTKVVFFAKLIP